MWSGLYYRPQTKFAKVMFLHLSVILFTGGACMAGGVWWEDMRGKGGMHGRGCAWQGGMHGRRVACVVGGGMHGRGGMHGGGACVAGGHAWQGACVVWFSPPPPQQILRNTVIRSMSWRYASYWNAFLFLCKKRKEIHLIFQRTDIDYSPFDLKKLTGRRLSRHYVRIEFPCYY